MKKFLFRLSIVLVPFVSATGAFLHMAYRVELDVLRNDLVCAADIQAAVVGDSRVEVYFDPNEIPWLRNFGLSGMPFAATAHKARLIAEMNPGLKLLVLDVWPGKFFESLEDPFPESAPYGVALIEMMTRCDMPPFGDGFDVRVMKGVWRPGLSQMAGGHGTAESQIAGGFMANEKSLLADIAKGYEYGRQFGPPPVPRPCPETPTGGEIVLEHLLADLTKKGVNVVLTTTPLLWYEKRYDARAREYFERRMEEISQKYHVAWYNWMHDYQTQTNYWADGLHLNDVGAKVFSREKKEVLSRYLAPAKL